MIPTRNTNRVMRCTKRFLGGVAMAVAICMIPAVSAQDRDRDVYRMTRIEPGTNVTVRTTEGIDVERRDDRVFRGVVDQDVRGENGRIAIPRGAPVELVVRVARDNDLIIDLNSVTVNGQRFSIPTDRSRVESRPDLVGSIIGAVSGEEVRGRAVHIHPNAILNFRIDRPMELAAAYQGYGGDHDRSTRIEPGTMLAVRTSEAIDVDRRDDRIYHGVVDQDIRGENGRLAIPRGSPVDLIVRVAPDNDLVIDVDSVLVNGQRYGMRTDPNRVESQRDLVGSIVGAVTGNEVRGRAVHIHPDTILNFRIDRPMEMGVADRDHGNRPNLK